MTWGWLLPGPAPVPSPGPSLNSQREFLEKETPSTLERDHPRELQGLLASSKVAQGTLSWAQPKQTWGLSVLLALKPSLFLERKGPVAAPSMATGEPAPHPTPSSYPSFPVGL